MMQKMTVEDVPVKGKLVFIRVDFNVPLDENGSIVEDTRIGPPPTINHCIDEGARIIVASHLGRSKGPPTTLSLAPVRKRLERLLNKSGPPA
jgi:phosphoglycerate kinase